MKKIFSIQLLITSIVFGFSNIDTTYASCMSEYGIGAYEDFVTGMCKCTSGYTWGKDIFGNDQCISMSTYCTDTYGFHAKYDYVSGGCMCSSGYTWGKDSLGYTTCISKSTYCTDTYGFNAKYDILSDNCECRYGYVFDKDYLGNLTCTSGSTVCHRDHGYNSTFNSLENTCECDNGYTFDEDGTCVKKQNNVYFLLKELDTDNKQAIIKSDYDNKYYLITYGAGCYSTSFKRYVGQFIVVNLGTDFALDTYDKIVLQDDNETCDIRHREKVDSTYSLDQETNTSTIDYINLSNEICPANSFLYTNGQCYCYEGMIWDETSSSCAISSSPTIPVSNQISEAFSDISNSINKEAISYVKTQGIVEGYSDGTYKPEVLINRAEFTKIVINALSFSTSGENCFSDVQNQWFAPYVCTAKTKGIIDGYPDGTFKPEADINQAEALKILLNAFNLTLSSDRGTTWYDVYVNTALDKELFSKIGLKVDEAVTRGEMAQFIYNIKNTL